MDVLNGLDDPSWGLDVCVKEKNIVVTKNSEKTADVAKEENGD